MRELELVGLHEDGEHLVLTTDDGESYTLLVNEALRAAVRRDRPALNRLQAQQKSSYTPRDIQSLLRAGRSPEEIAEISGLPLEHVTRYAGPILGEREMTATRARRFHVGKGDSPRLEDLVHDRLRARAASAGPVWDSWRRENGLWTLTLGFTAGGRERVAVWRVDLVRETLSAENDEARWITEDESPSIEEQPRRPRLAAVRNRVYDVEADGGVNRPQASAAPVSGSETAKPEPQAPERVQPKVVSSLWSSLSETEDSSAGEEAAGPAEPQPAEQAAASDSETGTVQAENSTDKVPAANVPAALSEETGTDFVAENEPENNLHKEDTAELDLEVPPAEKPAKKKSKQRRSSVPSWDEIVFGPGKH
ncbi:septation protein SepH [Dermabacteraceae bacterium P7074]